jgi:hypothetical protein
VSTADPGGSEGFDEMCSAVESWLADIASGDEEPPPAPEPPAPSEPDPDISDGSGPSLPPRAELGTWVAGFVESYEAWDQIPACWSRHGAMVEELAACWHLGLVLAMEAGRDVKAGAHSQADFWDYAGRMLERLSRSPGAACAIKGSHVEAMTWDRADSSARRRAARQLAQDYGHSSA